MSLLVAFDSTHSAIYLEKVAKAHQLKARLIGTPETISASCGLSLKAQLEDLESLWTLIQDNDLTGKVEVYKVVEKAKKKEYIEVFFS